MQHSYAPPGYLRFGKVCKVTTSADVIKAVTVTSNSQAASGANGDKYIIDLYLKGDETKLELGTVKGPAKGIFDLYVNDVLDSSGYDDYAAGTTDSSREITLTETVHNGYNIIELRVNSKNAASSGYLLAVYGVMVQ